MAPASATARIIFAACFFYLPLSFLSHHVAIASPSLSFSFDFSNSSSYPQQDLLFQGDATLHGDLVDLTSNPANIYRSGRISYSRPVRWYDNITGEVASFVTTFTFAINLLPNTTGVEKADGITFFLTGYPSRPLPGPYGLLNSSDAISSDGNRFLAVEFDTYVNDWDPTGSEDHIGIDLNSITSVMTTALPSYSLNGTMTATITFDSTTRTLEATLHFANSSLAPATVKAELSDRLEALLPHEVTVGFSAATGAYTELHQIHSWSFNSTMGARGAIEVPPKQGQVVGNKGHRRSILIFVVVLSLALVMTVIWSTISWCNWKRTRDSFGKGSRLKRFNYRDLFIATDKFSNRNEIGRGGFGVVYSGTLEKKQVAVKRIIKDSRGEFKDFLAELGAIDRTCHVNLVRIEGWCCSINNFMFWCFQRQNIKLFLVYELVPNGNLHQHLYENPGVLPWAMRYKIVKGLCSALHYLHHQCSQYILHRDIKPSNILLDNEFNAKLGDFGLSRVVQASGITSVYTEASVGTTRYMDPLCMKDGHVKLRPSSDVYSFGIVLLEIAHGKYDPEKVRKLYTNQPETFVNDVADKKLAGKFDKREIERVIVLGLRCSEPVDEKKRPSLDGAILQFLEKGGELPPCQDA